MGGIGIPVFDIEVLDWVTPVAVGFFDGSEYHEFLRLGEDYDVVWEFLSFLGDYEGMKLYAHNAADFDNKFILDSLIKHNQRIRFNSGMASLVWVEKSISFEDSYVLTGRSLATVCEAFDVPRKLVWEHDKTSSIWDNPAALTSFREYLQRDCISLSQAITKFCELLLGIFGVTPSSTLALTSIKAFNKRFYPVKKIDSNDKVEKFIRAATYGGRNEVYRKYGEDLNFYDVRSMYVSCYDVPVPIGKLHWTKPNLDGGTLAEAEVNVPSTLNIGPLPYRYLGRLVFPVGEFKSWWDTRELRLAAELGCSVSIIRQLEADEEPILKDFGEVIGNLRKDSNPSLSKIWKLIGVRLSGKFGQHRLRTEVKHVSEVEDLTGWYPLDDKEIYLERLVKLDGNRSPYVKPAINMRIRSEARIRHLKLLLKADPYYCDNDSIYTSSTLTTGREMGELNLVGAARRAYFIRGKFYGYVSNNGILLQKTSGYRDFRLTEYDFQKLLGGDKLSSEFQSLDSWKQTLKGEGINLVTRRRQVRSELDFENRISDGLITRPIKLSKGLQEL